VDHPIFERLAAVGTAEAAVLLAVAAARDLRQDVEPPPDMLAMLAGGAA
jgi:hypothetical protein